ncbi:MAG: hypothetical protein CL678_00095 [Bdellovibrionaceae bacterium]|nr:hypothetical protein [Pseudobdellovibrionaceae bacterium]|tara:strand:- start:3748 stop:4812 length:1065 start_codon:yes stop_codon:yes gene_type:complete
MLKIIVLALLFNAHSAFSLPSQNEYGEIENLATLILYERQHGSTEERIFALKDQLLIELKSLSKSEIRALKKYLRQQTKKARKTEAFLSSKERRTLEAWLLLKSALGMRTKNTPKEPFHEYPKACRIHVSNGLSSSSHLSKIIAEELSTLGFQLVNSPSAAMGILEVSEEISPLRKDESKVFAQINFEEERKTTFAHFTPGLFRHSLSLNFIYRLLDEPVWEEKISLDTGLKKPKSKRKTTLWKQKPTFNCLTWTNELHKKFDQGQWGYSSKVRPVTAQTLAELTKDSDSVIQETPEVQTTQIHRYISNEYDKKLDRFMEDLKKNDFSKSKFEQRMKQIEELKRKLKETEENIK